MYSIYKNPLDSDNFFDSLPSEPTAINSKLNLSDISIFKFLNLSRTKFVNYGLFHRAVIKTKVGLFN